MSIRYDVFPAHFVVAPPTAPFTDVHELTSSPPKEGSFYVQTCRVIISATHVTVASDSPTGPQIVFNEKYTSFEKPPKQEQDAYVVTESGKMIAFKKDTNCGCGSRLRAWNPYRTLGSINDPTE
jgi:hypothetical protein